VRWKYKGENLPAVTSVCVIGVDDAVLKIAKICAPSA